MLHRVAYRMLGDSADAEDVAQEALLRLWATADRWRPGQAGIAGHATIGRGARVAAQAGAFGDVPAGETWSGYPARPHREALRAQAAMFRLPSLMRGLERLLGAKGGDSDGGVR